jgi:hypothetical protein
MGGIHCPEFEKKKNAVTINELSGLRPSQQVGESSHASRSSERKRGCSGSTTVMHLSGLNMEEIDLDTCCKHDMVYKFIQYDTIERAQSRGFQQ